MPLSAIRTHPAGIRPRRVAVIDGSVLNVLRSRQLRDDLAPALTARSTSSAVCVRLAPPCRNSNRARSASTQRRPESLRLQDGVSTGPLALISILVVTSLWKIGKSLAALAFGRFPRSRGTVRLRRRTVPPRQIPSVLCQSRGIEVGLISPFDGLAFFSSANHV